MKKKNPTQKAAMDASRALVYAIVNYKGGVGKSTVTDHLAAHEKAVIIDLDRINQDSSRFGDAYGLEVYRAYDLTAESLYDLVERLRKEGKHVVIDCPPGESSLTKIAILCADVVVIPTRPGPHDVYALGRVSVAVREAAEARGRIPALYLCNFYRKTEVANIFVGILQASPDAQYVGKLWERKEYAESLAVNQPVWEFAPTSTGAHEMLNLVTFLRKAAELRSLSEAVND